MDERSLKYLYDACAAAQAIKDFAAGRSFAEYCGNEMLAAAIERKFEIIGEALARVRRYRPEHLEAIGDWPAIIGFRNLPAHSYDRVEDAVVWGIVTDQIPAFLDELRQIPGLPDLDDR